MMIVPHATTIDALFAGLQSSERGLTDAEVQARLQHYGANQLPMAPPVPAWRRFLVQFHNVLIYVLLLAAVASALLQHYLDAGVILAVVLVNALVGFIQEGKAEDALRAILSMTRTRAQVVREGVLATIDSAGLVPGDVVVLQAGDRVPADMRLFFVRDLRCDESALTGEAQPVGKHDRTLDGDVALAERKNMAFMGTLVTYGLARGLVTGTGLRTEIGAISDLVGKVELLPTPLQLQLARFARQLTVAIIAISALTMVAGMALYGYSAGDMFQAAVGIAVSAIPEGLPAIVTIALAIGVQRMARNQALVRRLPAVEVLGSVDVICSDKTGTLTANAMTARQAYTLAGHYRIGGEGYDPDGGITLAETAEPVLMDHDSCFTQACVIAMLCNDASLHKQQDQWHLTGDPTEGALLTLAMKHGLAAQQLADHWPRIDILPFESEKRYMATLHHDPQGRVRMLVKGAPEQLLSFASHELNQGRAQPLQVDHWQGAAQHFSARGMRVMALAYRDLDHRPDALGHDLAQQDLVLVGLVGISDPPRPEAIASIAQCHQAGIRVKMITGDSPLTATAIGRELGLDVSRVMTGQQIDAASAAELSRAVEQTDIFARASPANKLQLVSALQDNRHVVAMTGDGVNDAPALKRASIGVAMGQKGTDAAKEAADFVLTDDNFATITRAVHEGRTVYDNIVKSIVFILPTNLAEALVIIAAILLGRTLPITPAQILWVNMITAVTLALALAFERAERNIMQRSPRPFNQSLFTGALVGRMLLVGSLGALVVFSLFYVYRSQGASIEYARTIAVNSLVMVEVFYLLNCRFLSQSIFDRRFFVGSRPMWLACGSVISLQLVYSYWPLSQQLFGLASIGAWDWLMIVVWSAPVVFVVELEKALARRLMGSARQANVQKH